MKKIFLFALLATSVLQLFAQAKQQETIILQDNKNNSSTTIEIKDGSIFVDGKKVSSTSDKTKSLKIVKKNNSNNKGKLDESQIQEFNFPDIDMSMDAPTPMRKAMLGVSTKNSDNENGALVETVTPKSPAEKIGLEKGDVITKVNDKKIANPKELAEAISTFEPGEKIQLSFLRNNKSLIKEVELSNNTSETYTYRKKLPFSQDENGGMDMDLSDMLKPFMRQFDMQGLNPMMPSNTPKIGVSVEDRADGDGVLVTEVKAKSIAEEAGILAKDVITKIGTTQINNVDELTRALQANASKKEISAELKRNGATKTVVISLPKNLKKGEF
jgi:serine protease Do